MYVCICVKRTSNATRFQDVSTNSSYRLIRIISFSYIADLKKTRIIHSCTYRISVRRGRSRARLYALSRDSFEKERIDFEAGLSPTRIAGREHAALLDVCIRINRHPLITGIRVRGERALGPLWRGKSATHPCTLCPWIYFCRVYAILFREKGATTCVSISWRSVNGATRLNLESGF